MFQFYIHSEDWSSWMNVIVTISEANFATFDAAGFWYGNMGEEYDPAVVAGDSSTTDGFVQQDRFAVIGAYGADPDSTCYFDDPDGGFTLVGTIGPQLTYDDDQERYVCAGLVWVEGDVGDSYIVEVGQEAGYSVTFYLTIEEFDSEQYYFDVDYFDVQGDYYEEDSE